MIHLGLLCWLEEGKYDVGLHVFIFFEKLQRLAWTGLVYIKNIKPMRRVKN